MSPLAVSDALLALVRDPVGVLVRKWSWKCALFADLVFRGITSGFYGAMTQNFREADPPWRPTANHHDVPQGENA